MNRERERDKGINRERRVFLQFSFSSKDCSFPKRGSGKMERKDSKRDLERERKKERMITDRERYDQQLLHD